MKLTKEEYEALPDSVKAKFTATDDGDYSNGEEEASALKNALDRVREEKKAALEKVAEGEAAKMKEIEAAKAQALKEARETGDFAAIEKDYKERIAAAEQSHQALQQEINQSKTDAAKSKVLSEFAQLSTSPDTMNLIAGQRISMEVIDGEVIPRVLTKEGKPSAASIEDLKKEILDDPGLKGILVGGKGSGSGAHGSTTSNKSGAQSGDFKYTGAKPSAIVERLKAQGVGAEE